MKKLIIIPSVGAALVCLSMFLITALAPAGELLQRIKARQNAAPAALKANRP